VPISVDVVIVSYRSRELLRACLESLRDPGPAATLDVCVIDNASDDGTVDMVRSEFGEVRLIANRDNAGFGAASNQGIVSGAAPFVLVINPDARIEPDTLGPLLDVFDREPRAGMVGPNLVRPDGTLDHAAKRSFPTVAGALAYFTGLASVGRGGLDQYTAPEVQEGRVDAINGAFMLIRRAALDEVGLFDPGYWMYMEDLDLCYRLWRAGWEVHYEPRATAWHLKGGSAGPVRSPRLNLWFHRGMARFYRKFYAPERPWPANLVVYAGIGAKLLVSLARGALTRRRGL
jgi:N-acetylglucosaminyl-diphospho-decaprenol L-rhamnosyltransferase